MSRTQRFTFKAIDEQDAVRHLGEIARQEGMEVDEEALKLLATHGGGSFRDSISLLDQVGHSKKSISKADAEKLVGVAAKEHITGILHAVANGTPADILTVLDKLTEDGIAPSQATKQLTAEIRTMVVQGLATEQHVNLLADLLSVSASTDPRSQLEVALIRANFAARPAAAPQAATPQIQTESAEPAPAEPPSEALPAEPVEQPAESTETVAEDPPAAISTFTLAEGTPAEWWNDVLNQIKTINNTLYGVLRMAEASVADETLRLSFAFGFHQKKISDVATQAKIQEAVKTITGKMYRIEPVHDKAVGKAPQVTAAVSSAAHPEPAANPTGDISSITNIFGGGEVLES